MYQRLLSFPRVERGLHDISAEVAAALEPVGLRTGMCNLFLRHTSASLTIQENADPDVLLDLQAFLTRLVPDGDTLYRHTSEGPDDMPAHVRTVLTSVSLNIPLMDGRLALGTWQGIYLWEHRRHGGRRQVVLTAWGE